MLPEAYSYYTGINYCEVESSFRVRNLVVRGLTDLDWSRGWGLVKGRDVRAEEHKSVNNLLSIHIKCRS